MTAAAPDLLAGLFSPVGADEDLTALAQCYRLARERARAARLAAQAQATADAQPAAGADTQPAGGPQ